eukprot:scaffold6290_cov104-Cylindrotheca_fusiformis.AAC.1
MSLCGSVEQTREIRFHAFDNRLRDNATLAVLMHIGKNIKELPIRQVEPYLYEFGFSNNRLGVAILEILVNGVQIRESPIRVEISPRDCDVEYADQNKVPVRSMRISNQHDHRHFSFNGANPHPCFRHATIIRIATVDACARQIPSK